MTVRLKIAASVSCDFLFPKALSQMASEPRSPGDRAGAPLETRPPITQACIGRQILYN